MPVNKNAMLRYRIIDNCLNSKQRKYPSLEFIIERIEAQLDTKISVSMLNKDLKQMRDTYDAPIKYSHQHGGYYYDADHFSILDFPLTPDEVEALDYSTALLNSLKGSHLFSHFENAINKLIEGYRISSVVGNSTSPILQVEQPLADGGSYWLKDILQAIVNRSALRFLYQGFGKEEKEYILSPYLVKEYRNRWYMVGWVHGYRELRVFALDRLQDLLYTEESYIASENFDAEEFFQYSFGITQVDHMDPIEAKLYFKNPSAHYVKSMPLHHSQKILMEDSKGIEVEIKVYPTKELVMTLLSYGNEVTVISPQLLVKMMKKEIKAMQSLYE